MIRIAILMLLCLWPAWLRAQHPTYTMSNPLNTPESGVYKVLCMANGNTMLLHLEHGKPIAVKIYDSTHQLRVAREHGAGELNVNLFKTSVFKGLFEINGEAVLFFQQPHLGRQRLVRARIDGTSGELTGEDVIGESKSMARPTQFYVMHTRGANDYAILHSTEVRQFKECDLQVVYYTKEHNANRTVKLDVDRKNFDYMDVLGAEQQREGVCISLSLTRIRVSGTGVGIGGDSQLPDRDTLDNYMYVYYIPAGADAPRRAGFDLGARVSPYLTHFSYNPFIQGLHVLLFSYWDLMVRNGLEYQPMARTASLLTTMQENDLSARNFWVTNTLATNELRVGGRSVADYNWVPAKVITSGTGLTTVISEEHNRRKNIETNARSNVFETYFGNLCLTQYNDEGEELWGKILPKAQYYKSYRQYYRVGDIAKHRQEHVMFTDLPAQVYERQFVSFNAYSRAGKLFIVYNDLKKNLQPNRAGADTVFSFDQSTAVYYKIDRNKEVTKHNMFEDEPEAEYRAGFIEGADFDEQRGVYATLVQTKRRNYTSLRMAWCRLD